MSLQNIIAKTEEYLCVPAVVRFEHPFMNHLAAAGCDVEKKDRVLVVTKQGSKNGVFNADLVARLRAACERDNIKYEMKDELIETQNAQLPEGSKPKKLGKTELGRIIQHTDGRFNGATFQIPSTDYHSNHETTTELALNNYYQALKGIFRACSG